MSNPVNKAPNYLVRISGMTPAETDKLEEAIGHKNFYTFAGHTAQVYVREDYVIENVTYGPEIPEVLGYATMQDMFARRVPIPDPVNHPTHYTSHPSGVECIQITRHMSFNLGNAIKYLWRKDLKNGIEDLEKAVWYIQDEIKRLKTEAQ